MRFSLTLCKQHLGWHFKRSWELHRKRSLPNLMVSPYLQRVLDEKQMTIIEPVFKEIKLNPEYIQPDPRLRRKPTGINDPLYKERACHIGSGDTQLLEGKNQAMVLTKTIPKPGLPKVLEDLPNESVKDQDQRVQEVIMQALVWDPTQDKLPRDILPEKTWYICKRVYGIPMLKKNQILCSGFLHMCESLAFKYPRLLNRRVMDDTMVSVPYEIGNDLVQLNYEALGLLTTNRPLSAFSSKEDVDESKDIPLPDIYPLRCTIDLDDTQFYSIHNKYVVSEGYTHGFPHTLFLSHHVVPTEKEWSDDQLHAKAVLGCFSYTAALARLKYGENIKKLPVPINIQCIQIVLGKTFHFYAYQLNTLDMGTEDGVKNFIWVDPAHNLHGGFEPDSNVLLDYNPEVFKKVLNFYLNEAV